MIEPYVVIGPGVRIGAGAVIHSFCHLEQAMVAAGAAIAWFSGPGQRFLAFAKDAWSETKRVVWPERKETWMVTAYVFAFVVVMALFLWVTDKTLEWALYDLILGWRR